MGVLLKMKLLLLILITSTLHAQKATMSHVYSPDRLKVIKSDTTIIGRVKYVRIERDGDWHILLESGLVAECICQVKATIDKATKACVGYNTKFRKPHAGDKIAIRGPYVFDIKHGWYEIHPVSKIIKL